MRTFKRVVLHGAAALLLAGASFAHAQPADNRGQDQHQGQGQQQGQDQARGQAQEAAPGQGRAQPGERTSRGGEGWQGEARSGRNVDYGPRIDEREIRRLLLERRDWIEIDRSHESLPPGIRMNLERGKPLPPGIAKQLDERILRDLPRYDGYEWRRVGPDVILVDAANAVIYEILRDIFY
jgi:Ni/Co efflux regulator RcnB